MYTLHINDYDYDLVNLLTQANNRIMQRSWLLRELNPVHVIHFQTKMSQVLLFFYSFIWTVWWDPPEGVWVPEVSTEVPDRIHGGAEPHALRRGRGLQLRHPPAGRGGDGVTAKWWESGNWTREQRASFAKQTRVCDESKQIFYRAQVDIIGSS